MSTGPAAPKLNQKDAEVLEFIATSRWITHQQLSEVVQIRGIETNRKVFEWRVRRLAQCGLLKKQRPAFLNRNILYSITRTGIYGLEHIGVHPLSLGADNDDGEIKIKHHIPHSLEINRIRIAMLRSGTLVRWTPGAWIRLLLRAGQKRYAKVYDAVAAVMVHGEIYEIGLEYERSLKTTERYHDIAQILAEEHRAQAVVYLCSNREIFKRISDVFSSSQTKVLVAMMDQFVADPLDARTQFGLLSTTLREELGRIGPHDCRATGGK